MEYTAIKRHKTKMELPKGWKTLEFAKLAERSKEKFNPKKEGEHLPCIELEHIEQEIGQINGHVSSDSQLSIKNKFQKGQVLFGKLRPYLRKYWHSNFDGVCSSEIWVLDAKKDACLNEFLFFLVQSHRFIEATKVSSGSKMPRADWDYISKFPFSLPPLNEQQKIAEILSTWDRAIEKTQKLIQQLQLRKKGLMQQLLTGRKRLSGFDGGVTLTKLKGLLKEKSDRNKYLGVKRVLSVTNSRGFINQSEQFDRKVASKDLSNYKIVRKGQFAYNPSRVNVGSIDLLRNFDEGLLSPMYIIFETDDRILNPDFLYYQLKTWWFIGHIPQFVQGSVRDSLSFDGLESMSFYIPSLEEQKAIASVIETADQEISLQQEYLEQLQSQKKGLMQQLLTGRIRVKL